MASGFKWALVRLEVARFSLPFEGLICISYVHCGVSDYASSYCIETGRTRIHRKRRSEICQVKRKVAPVSIKRHVMKMYEGVEIQRHVLLILGFGQVHVSAALPLRKSHQNPLNWWLGGPQVTIPERKYVFPSRFSSRQFHGLVNVFSRLPRSQVKICNQVSRFPLYNKDRFIGTFQRLFKYRHSKNRIHSKTQSWGYLQWVHNK